MHRVVLLLAIACAPVLIAPADADAAPTVANGLSDPLPATTSSQFITPRGTDHPVSKIGTSSGSQQKIRPQTSSWWTSLGGLVVVIALILGAARVLKKHVPAARGVLPPEVLEVLGRKHLELRHSIHLVRCGSRILVLGSSPQGLTPLAEITDPVEVDFLAGLCRRNEPHTVVGSFGQWLRGFSSDDTAEPETDVASQRLKDRLEQTATMHTAAADHAPAHALEHADG